MFIRATITAATATKRRWLLMALIPILIVLAWLTCWERKPVWQIAFSPDGKLLATASGTPGRNSAQVWHLPSRKKAWSINSPTGVIQVAFSPDGLTLAMGHFGGSVELWDVASGQQLSSIAAASSNIVAMAFSSDGKTLVCVGVTGVVKLCDVATGTTITAGAAVLPGAVAISRDAKRLAVSTPDRASSDDGVTVYNISAGQLKRAQSLPGPMASLAFSPDGELLACVPFIARVRPRAPQIFDVKSGEIVGTIADSYVEAIDFSEDGRTLASGNRWGFVQFWNVAAARRDWGFPAFQWAEEPIAAVRLSPDGSSVAAVARQDGQVHVWDLDSKTEQAVLPGNVAIGAIFAGWLIAFALWAAAWVASGLPMHGTYVRLVDFALINGIVIAALVARIANTGRPGDTARPAVAFGVGWLAGLVGLLIIWIVLSRRRWQWQLPALVTVWSLVWALPAATAYARDRGQSPAGDLTIGAGAMFATLLAALWLFRSRGVRLRSVVDCGDLHDAPRQFLLKDLVLWTAAAGLLFGVARHVAPRIQPLSFQAVLGAGLGLTAAAALCAGRGRSPLALRLPALLAVSVASGSMILIFRDILAVPWWWFVSIHVTEALCVAGSLLILGRGLAFAVESNP